MDVILAIDEGTSGTRAALVAADGHVDAQHYRPLSVTTPRAGVVEQDADDILAKTVEACRATIAEAAATGRRIVALAIATQRATAVLWDATTGRALVPAMVWQDTQYADELKAYAPRWDRRLRESAGRPVGVRSPYLWAVHHLKDTPAVAEAHAKGRLRFGTMDTWLLWHLTADRLYATTPTNATSGNAYVIAEHRYEHAWVDTLGFPRELLPALRQDADDFGRTRVDLLGIDVPILACLGDQHAAAVGLGCLDPGQALCIHGTGSFVDQIVGTVKPLPGDADGTLTMTARRVDGVSHFAVETFVATTGSALNWVCDKLHWFADAKAISALAATVDGSNGVVFVPSLTGLRVPEMEANARASLTGISIATTQAEVAYAVLEGIAHAVASCVEANVALAGHRARELLVGGGLAASEPLLRMQADLTGMPVRRMRESDRASLRGAAFVAGRNGLLWESLEAACATVASDGVVEPAQDAGRRQARRALWHSRIAGELAHAKHFRPNQPPCP